MSNDTISKPRVLDSEPTPQLDTHTLQPYATDFFPRLACQINLYSNRLILSQHGREFVFEIDRLSGLPRLFSLMDGTRSLDELQRLCSPENPTAITTLINNLDNQGLVDNAAVVAVQSGREVLLELDALTQQLLAQTPWAHAQPPLWQLLQLATPEIPNTIIYGFALEHYHLFSHMGCIQSPTLGFQGSTKIRHRLNQLYVRTSGYEQLMKQVLHEMGIISEQLACCLPLPETMSMYNGLAFWANFEPFFFLSILGSLFERVLSGFKPYLVEIEGRQPDARFVQTIRQLVDVQQKNQHDILGQSIFQDIPHIDRETERRFKDQIHLYVEMYGNFYRAIGHHYVDAPHFLRRIAVS